MDIKELKQRAGIVEQVGDDDEALIRMLNLAITKLNFGSVDDTRYYISQVIQTLRARVRRHPS